MKIVLRNVILALTLTLGAPASGLDLTDSGLPTRWPIDRVPLFVVPHPALAKWMPEIHQAAKLFNRVTQTNVLVVLRPTMVSNYSEMRHPPVMLMPSEGFASEITVDEETGFIEEAALGFDISEDYTHEVRLAIAVHGLGLVLGLNEANTADKPYNIMNQDIPLAGGKLLPADIDALRRAYNPPAGKLMKSTGHIRWTRKGAATDLCDSVCLADQSF